MKIKEYKEPLVYLWQDQDKWYSDNPQAVLIGIFQSIQEAAWYGEEVCNWTFRHLWDTVTIVDNS